jgi:hypothetical protein
MFSRYIFIIAGKLKSQNGAAIIIFSAAANCFAKSKILLDKS